MYSITCLTRQSTGCVAIGFAVLIAFVSVGSKQALAQRPESTTLQTPEVDPPDFSGSWQNMGLGFNQQEACGSLKDPSGAPMIRCSQPWEAKGGAKEGLKDYLNARGLAWMQFRDEAMAMKHQCAPNTMPSLFDQPGGIGSVHKHGPGELIINALFGPQEDVVITVWMDGRKHLGPHHRFYQGDSIGWYEGDELVIETTNFTFDPDGLEDHTHVPSSPMKKLTQRWKKTGPDTLDIQFTQEDPMFLKKPWKWTWHYRRVPQLPIANFICDPGNAWDEVIVTGASRYSDE